MKNKIVIGVDGISYSGKTTLCNKIEEISDTISVVYESPKFANTKIKITNDDNEIINNSKKTLEIEKLRTEYVKNNCNNILLFDRTVYSFIAISYAYYKTNIINYYSKYLEEIIKGIENGEFLIPDYLVYLNIT